MYAIHMCALSGIGNVPGLSAIFFMDLVTLFMYIQAHMNPLYPYWKNYLKNIHFPFNIHLNLIQGVIPNSYCLRGILGIDI